ncbi:MAG: M48 family metalloprotease [Deltaproteobacteria bacterium]|jgi:predicted Zn-dependent protease
MKHTKIMSFILLILFWGLTSAGHTARAGTASQLPQELNHQKGDDLNRARVQIAGLLDKLLDPESKERKLLEGATTVMSAAGEIDYKSERTIGESLALEGFRRYGLPVHNPELQRYVNLVGLAVARNGLRPGIPYAFVVVDSPLQNAFSCPGGIIFISKGLMDTIQNEAQLACVLAHEVAHVGHKHALKSIQRARFFKGVGKITSATMEGEKGKQFESMIGDLQNVLFDKGLDQNMEFEADKTAMETAYRTGYDPQGMIQVLVKLKAIESKSQKKGSWFSTHPPLTERIGRCQSALRQYPDAGELAHEKVRFKTRTQ